MRFGQPVALGDLVDRLGGSWSAVLSEHPDTRGIRVGFLMWDFRPVSIDGVDWDLVTVH